MPDRKQKHVEKLTAYPLLDYLAVLSLRKQGQMVFEGYKLLLIVFAHRLLFGDWVSNYGIN